MEKNEKKKYFLQNRPAITALRLVSILTIFDVWCMLSQSRGTLASRYVYLRVPSSVQQPCATLSKYAFYGTCSFCLCHLYPTPSRNSFVFIRLVFVFFVALISGRVFFVVLSYPVRLHLICLPWFFSEVCFFFSVSLSVTTEFVSLYDEESGRTLGVLLIMSLGRKNGLTWKQQQQSII